MGVNDHMPGNPRDDERAHLDPVEMRRHPASPRYAVGGGGGLVALMFVIAAIVGLVIWCTSAL